MRGFIYISRKRQSQGTGKTGKNPASLAEIQAVLPLDGRFSISLKGKKIGRAIVCVAGSLFNYGGVKQVKN
ncbi:hypothetical protein ACO0LO_11840 [Undibacterium sp. TJN25]|uniref:hypothetical protein n=1 Tax=Undibacterium sp. TJN25 TaxID=3413056 RepID=UPI003BF0B2CB